MREAIRAAIEALDGLIWYVGQLETLVYSDDDKGEHEQVTAAESALSLLREAGGGGEDADLAVKFRAQHDFLEWNRQQAEPLVKIAYEYGVFDKAVELYKAAMKEGK